MGRKKKPPAATAGQAKCGRAAARVTVIEPNGIYGRLAACEAVGLGEASLSEEVRAGRINAALAPDGSWLIPGDSLLAWVRERARRVRGGQEAAPDGQGEGENGAA